MPFFRSVTRELPGNVPYAAKLSLFQTFRATWGTATLSCFSDVEVEFKEAVMELIQEQFSRYSGLISAVKYVFSPPCATRLIVPDSLRSRAGR